jgi:hypothetical protein
MAAMRVSGAGAQFIRAVMLGEFVSGKFATHFSPRFQQDCAFAFFGIPCHFSFLICEVKIKPALDRAGDKSACILIFAAKMSRA